MTAIISDTRDDASGIVRAHAALWFIGSPQSPCA